MIKITHTKDCCSGCGTTPSFEIELGYSNMSEKHRMCAKCIDEFQTALGLTKKQAAPESDNNEKVWHKAHKLKCDIDYFLDERNSKLGETVQAKHAWDMILMHISRELSDIKSMLREQ